MLSFDEEDKTETVDFGSTVALVSSWLSLPAGVIDDTYAGDRKRIVAAIRAMNEAAANSDQAAFHHQQLLLSRIYAMHTSLPHQETAERSVLLFEVTRLLEDATIAAEDAWIESDLLDQAPAEGKAYVSWLKGIARRHRVFKHPYYVDFINRHANVADLRRYVIQESLIDSRFDDLLAMMQVGTSGPAKMEIASNYWDEMGNGRPEEVHTHLFNKIYEVFDITDEELEEAMTASDLLAGNLAVLLCRYRHLFPEAVGFLGMTEWLVPDRFTNVVHSWERLGLPDVGIAYHRLHITIDSKHAAGWFHNIVAPTADSDFMRRGITRGAMWRLNSSARHLDERLAQTGYASSASS